MRMTKRLKAGIMAIAPRACAATLFAAMISSPVSAQTPKDLLNAALSDLQAHFAFMEVRATINLPATEDGVDVRTWMTPSVDLKRNLNRCSRHGIAVKPGGSIQVGLIKKKDKHIEFHLGAGGWEGRSPYAPQAAAKSTDELNLEAKLRTAEGREAETIRRQLAHLREMRLEADKRAQAQFRRTLAEHKRKKVAAGSRFNIRYKKNLTPDDLTPESVMAALAPYLKFGPEEETSPPIDPTQPDPPAVTDYEKLKTHVVKIESSKANGQDTGGGVIVGVDGSLVLVATAFHVVEDATDVKVYFMEK